MPIAILRDFAASTVLFAFAAAGVAYLNVVFNAATRWMALILLVVVLVPKWHLLGALRSRLGLACAAFGIFAVFSSAWSAVPLLSFTKGGAFLVVILAMTGAGYAAAKKGAHTALRSLLPLALLVVAAALGGTVAPTSVVQMNEAVALYRGLAGNSNFLGLLCLCALPSVLVQQTLAPSAKQRRFWLLATLVVLATLVSTMSRASMLAGVVVFGAYLTGLGLRIRVGLLLALVLPATLAILLTPSLSEELERRYIYKGSETSEIFETREVAWSESKEGAMQGGVFGLGFGVSAGHLDFEGGFESSDYGREKGNAYLAILEETGAVGLILYLGFLTALLFSLLAFSRKSPRGSDERLLGLTVFGSILAMNINAQFESWLLAPGSPATPVYWFMVGVGIALCAGQAKKRADVFSADGNYFQKEGNALR